MTGVRAYRNRDAEHRVLHRPRLRQSVGVGNFGDDWSDDFSAISWMSKRPLRRGLSASCICFLFADLFVPSLRWWNRLLGVPAMRVPSSDSLVAIGPSETTMLAVALWDLQVQGCVEVTWQEPTDRRWRQPDRSGFGLRFARRGEGTTVGLEAELLEALGDGQVDLFTLINDRWRRGQTLAVNGVIVVAQREALAHGLLQRVPTEQRLPKALKWSRSLPSYESRPDHLANLADAGSAFAEDVAHLKRSRNLAWAVLVRETQSAVAGARPVFFSLGDGGG